MVKTSDCGSDIRGFESHYPPHKKDCDFCYRPFYYVNYRVLKNPTDRKVCLGSSANELRAKVLSLEQTKFVKRKTVDPLNASEQDNPTSRPIKKTLAVVKVFFISGFLNYSSDA